MSDSDNRFTTDNQPQEQSTLDWLYNTAVSFLPSWNSSTPSPEQTTAQQPTSGPCEKTSAPVCKCNKNKPK